MRVVIGLILAGYLASGCAGGGITHEDSPAATKRSEGPALCRDGTAPPCNDR